MDAVPGGVLLADEHVIVSHLPLVTPSGREDRIYLGRLLVEPRRHIEGLEELTNDEASSLGRFVADASRALKVAGGAEHVYAAVISDQVKHTHLHLLPRYPGTPPEYYWTRVDEWPSAPTGDAAAVGAFVDRLRDAVG
jgi:diadenosine tetraphosphate (Ap4A) HIT family hydrolase